MTFSRAGLFKLDNWMRKAGAGGRKNKFALPSGAASGPSADKDAKDMKAVDFNFER